MRALDSPCTDVCTLDAATRTCLGCGRTLDEIEAWAGLTAGERAAINARLPASRCSRCGATFTCGATDCDTPCWCASYPPVAPVAGAACMCPACLAATVAAVSPG